MFEESEEKPNFELDKEEFEYIFEICWICKNRHLCPMMWECETIANMDHDHPNNRVE